MACCSQLHGDSGEGVLADSEAGGGGPHANGGPVLMKMREIASRWVCPFLKVKPCVLVPTGL